DGHGHDGIGPLLASSNERAGGNQHCRHLCERQDDKPDHCDAYGRCGDELRRSLHFVLRENRKGTNMKKLIILGALAIAIFLPSLLESFMNASMAVRTYNQT